MVIVGGCTLQKAHGGEKMKDKMLICVSAMVGFAIAALVTFGIISLIDARDNAGYDEAYVLGSKTFAATAECTDEEFLKTADRAAKLISDTVVEGVKYDLLFKLETADDVFYIRQQRLPWETKGWKQLCRKQIVEELVRAEEVTQAHQDGKTVKVASIVLSCPVYHEDGSDWYTISTSDNDNDGIWDHKSVFC